jgi:hypothetical protein
MLARPAEQAAQHGAGADAAVRPKIVGFLKAGFHPNVFPIYESGAAQRQAVGRALSESVPCQDSSDGILATHRCQSRTGGTHHAQHDAS